MILLHRLTPFLIALVVAAGFGLVLISAPVPILLSVCLSFVVAFLLFCRLAQWDTSSFLFWTLVGIPGVFLASGFGMFLFLEGEMHRMTLAIIVTFFTFLFAEQIFAYIHAPTTYQAYAIEYLSLVLNVLSLFFAGVAAFGAQMFLQPQLWILIPSFAALVFFLLYATLWVGKVDPAPARTYAFVGALLLTELFTVILFLPTGYYANAAFLAVCLYVFLGLSRARFLQKLSGAVAWRYVGLGVGFFLLIAATAPWR